MQAALAFITLYGLSFTFWGVVGLVRFVAERRTWSAPPELRLSPSFAVAIGGFGLLAILQSARLTVPSSTVPFTGVLFGLLGGFIAARMLGGERRSAVAPVAHAALYWMAFLYLYLPVAAERQLSVAATSLQAGTVLALSLVASWIGYRMGRQTWSPAEASAQGRQAPTDLTIADIAVLVPAHNEEKSIGACIAALKKVIPPGNVFVASDGSTDGTVRIGREAGCNVLDIQPNRGKARALQYVLDHFSICRRYKAVLIMDADSEIEESYLKRALILLRDPSVVAIAGHATPKWHRHLVPEWSMLFPAYRVRLYRILQAMLRYGQTWKYVNVSFIVPGFASMYRCDVLPKIDIAAPGLIIEDYNMTFELHHKKLGRIAYNPNVRCFCHDPYSLRDYLKQVKRWNLGFWQTLRRHGMWPSVFCLALGTFVLEMLLQSVILLSIPGMILWLALYGPVPLALPLVSPGTLEVELSDFIVGVIVADYALTVIVAAIERNAMLLIYGLGFIFLRWIDAFLFLLTLPLTFFVKSDGRWVSPARA